MANRSEPPATIVARQVSKRFLLRHNRVLALKDRLLALLEPSRREQLEPFWAVSDVTLSVAEGEALGLVGRNGSGKSTFLKLVAGIYRPTTGALFVRTGARIGTMIELGVGFHPELTALENIYLNASIHGLLRAEIDALVPSIVEYSGLANFMDLPLKGFSSGMHMRLAFAIAANLRPEVLLIDEVFAVGDADFQARCTATMREFRERGATVLFVSHSPSAVREVCTRVAVLQAGRLVADGSVDDGLACYADLVADARAAALPGAAGRPAPEQDPEDRAARRAMGGAWTELGPWALDLLRNAGLRRESAFLDVGCGSMPVAVSVLPELDQSRYWGYEFDRALLEHGLLVELPNRGLRPERGHFIMNSRGDLSESPYRFDLALGHSLAHRLPVEALGSLIAAVVGHLAPHGRFFLSLPPDRADARAMAERVSATIGARFEPLAHAGHPRGEDVWQITRD